MWVFKILMKIMANHFRNSRISTTPSSEMISMVAAAVKILGLRGLFAPCPLVKSQLATHPKRSCLTSVDGSDHAEGCEKRCPRELCIPRGWVQNLEAQGPLPHWGQVVSHPKSGRLSHLHFKSNMKCKFVLSSLYKHQLCFSFSLFILHQNHRLGIWVVLQKLPQLSDTHFSQILNKLGKNFFYDFIKYHLALHFI